MMPDPAASLPVDQSLLGQILLEQGKTNAVLAAITEQLKALPDHEARLRQLERNQAESQGGRDLAARWWAAAAVFASTGSAAAAWFAAAHR